MTEPLTIDHALRAGPQIMIRATKNGSATASSAPEKVESAEDGVRTDSLSTEERRILRELKQRDSSVRQEEETHARMLGRHAGAIRYEYQIGPDGRVYVINGSVEVAPKITSTDPEEIKKILKTIQRAAVTVANPSQADRNVAATVANKAAAIANRQALESYIRGRNQVPPDAAMDPAMLRQLNVQA